MDESSITQNSIIEFYVSSNLPKNYELDKITNMISDFLEEDDKVVFYIPGSKMASEIFFTLKKVIIAQRFSGEWGGDIILPYEDIHNLEIQRQNRLFFIKLDLMVKLKGITFYVKKSEVDNFKKLMWDIFELK
jgi:hypothetical protein